MRPLPPKYPLRFLRWYCKDEYLEEMEGDIVELFEMRHEQSPRRAKRLFWWDVLKSFRLINIRSIKLNNWTMNLLGNYTRIYFRRFGKEISHYLVNILGLAMGFTILFFIMLYANDEKSFDDYHSNTDRVYRLITKVKEENGIHSYLSTPGPFAEALKEEFPFIEEAAHITYTGSQVLAKGDNRFADREWSMATSDFFKIWDIPIIQGDPLTQFKGSVGVVLTEDLAKRLFGRIDVVGEVLDQSRFGTVEVLAIMKELPKNSTYRFNNIYVLNTLDGFNEGWQRYIKSWDGRFAQTWVLFKEGTDPSDLAGLKDAFLDKYLDNENTIVGFDFQNVKEMHLGSEGLEAGGMNPRLSVPYSNGEFISMVFGLGFLVIFIAALNYVNLSSVQALKRTLEASMRKINGAKNSNLVFQLFYETLLTVLIAYAISWLLMLGLFTFFLDVANKDLPISSLIATDLILVQVVTVLVIWFFSALLPALYYSKLKRSLLILKNAFSGKGDVLRKVLVGVQYAFSIFLIIGSMVIYRQLNYIQSKDLGFDDENLIILDINSGKARRSYKQIIQGIKENSNVINASTSSRVPGEWKNIPRAKLAKSLSDEFVEVSHYGADHNWLDTYRMRLKDGENFTGIDHTDSLSILINDQTASLLNLEQPIGEQIWVVGSEDSVKMKIIGVIEDFHYESLYQPIGPVVVTSWNNHIRSIDYFTIRYGQNPKEALEHIEQVNATFDPETPAEINFLDDQLGRFYKAEESRAVIILIASIVSIIISAFGLFGLINFTVERKTKEIGIRKVLGASFAHITRLVLQDYIILLGVALIVAAPVSWWLFSGWLAGFAYRINLGFDLVFISIAIILVISFTTVIARILRIATSNPVKSLRYE